MEEKTFVEQIEERHNTYLTALSEAQIKVANVLFAKTDAYVEEYQLDICDMNQTILASIFAQVGWTKYSTFNVYVNAVRKYTSWCISERLCDDINPAKGLKFEDIAVYSVRRTYYKDDRMFMDTLCDIFQFKTSEGNWINASLEAGAMRASSLILAWLGFSTEESCEIKKSDIDVVNRSIVTPSWSAYDIPKDMMFILDYTRRLESITLFFHNVVEKRYQDTPYLLRIIRTKRAVSDSGPVLTRRIAGWNAEIRKLSKQNLSTVNPHHGRNVSLSRIRACGQLYRLKQWSDRVGETPSIYNFDQWKSLVRVNVATPGAITKEYRLFIKAFYSES